MKYIWWTLIILWAIPEIMYMVVTKEPSKIAQFLLNKVGL
jgi:hypothetical protein